LVGNGPGLHLLDLENPMAIIVDTCSLFMTISFKKS
jgi:hypothetical protein